MFLMSLPNPQQALISQQKITQYLLSSTHPVGRFKAAFFQALGYRLEHWERLEADIRKSLLHPAISVGRSAYGEKYTITSIWNCPNQKSTQVVTVWIILNGEDFPRFITAYPGDKS